MTNPQNTPRQTARAGLSSSLLISGFTLVELLVVIGIIALLISILLPALNKARQASQRTVCATRLQQIMVAANVHRADHKDYYPLAGILTGGQPQELDDSDTVHYDYLNTSPGSGYNAPTALTRALAPITNALGAEMGYKNMLFGNSNQMDIGTVDQTGLTRCFFCPSQCQTIQDFLALENYNSSVYVAAPPNGNPYGYYNVISASSYVFNEVVVGFNDSYGRLRGHASQVRQPAQTMFACDGNGDNGASPQRPEMRALGISNCGTFTLFNNFPNGTASIPGNPAITLADLYTVRTGGGIPIGGTQMCFDTKRHKGKMNIAFCDGHVETRNISAGDLTNVFLMPP